MAMPELMLVVARPELLAVPELLLLLEASQHPPPMYSLRQVSSEGGRGKQTRGPKLIQPLAPQVHAAPPPTSSTYRRICGACGRHWHCFCGSVLFNSVAAGSSSR